ncbi:potassium voltage-gated channel subfamily H member 6-like [Vespula maculifrons]|uniref:Potassium voltage-gated channel subfamily H member 6-like n=1 Tax=Vespula maculifrons TaxID=7453 RepID=A0ABD2CXV3_VESMC
MIWVIRLGVGYDRSFLVANAQQGLCHIIYCSDGFCRLTGFSRAEVMQRPAVCEFLHGPMTSPHAVAALRDALAAGVEKHFEILYYRKDDLFDVKRIVSKKLGKLEIRLFNK